MPDSPADRPALPLTDDLGAHPDLLNTRHGVFYPTGCEVYAFASIGHLEGVWSSLPEAGFPKGDVVVLTAAQMRQLADDSHANATTAAEIAASELKQVDILRDLATTHGAVFLIARAGAVSDQTRSTLIEHGRPLKALSYGMLTISELVREQREDLTSSPLGINERAR